MTKEEAVMRARAAAVLLAIDALVATGSPWKDVRQALIALNEEDHGNLEEFVTWFNGDLESLEGR